MTAAVPVLGCVVFAALAIAQPPWFDALVREDSALEWGEVGAYVVAAVVSARVALRTRGFVALAYGLLAVAAVAAVGEELSWGQRLFNLSTPESLAEANRQHELNLHNLSDVESAARLVMLGAALYGATLPLLRPPGPFVPPRALVPAFAVVAVYFAVRLAFLPHPTYVQAKFSEWLELCFAAAVALTACATLGRCRQPELPPGLLSGLQLPGTDNGVFDRIGVAAFEVGDDHHVLGEAPRNRERLRERLE
jgi:hypothetical protein